MKIDYIKLSPTQNITVLVSTPVPREAHGAIAAQLLGDPAIGGEQVGYIEPTSMPGAQARLQMMGGEFCGNATMSLGAVLAREAGLGDGERLDLLLEVSGSDTPVPCRIRRDGEGWIGQVRMPLPTRIGTCTLPTDRDSLTLPLVELPGISHLILPASAGLNEAELRRRLPQWCDALSAEALGALAWDAQTGAMDPLVYVPSAGTLVREHGCGSGSAAIGCWLTHRAGHGLEIDIQQPGGTIRVKTDVTHGALSAVTITGRVTLVSEGQVQLEA